MTAYRFFSVKMFKLLHQYNNMVETTHLTNNQMPNVEVSTSFQSLNLAWSIGSCGKLPQIS